MMEKNDNLCWKPLRLSELYKTRVFNLAEVTSLSPKGEEKKFIKLQAPEWVIVIPVIKINGETFFFMVKQWRHGSETICVEFPGGVADSGELPVEAAKRDLYEETGKEAKQIKLLAELYPNPAIMQNKCYIFLAECTEKTGAGALDEDEFLTAVKLPVQTVIENMGTPPYDHALMNAALMLYLKDIGALKA